MKSKAAIFDHPIHPILIAFPVAFLSGAVVSDIVAYLYAPSLYGFASKLMGIGVVTALVAAVPGAIDLFWAVPPNSSARARGLIHMAVNVGAVILFAMAWYLRNPDLSFTSLSVVLEFLGAGALGVGGWNVVLRTGTGRWHRCRRHYRSRR